MALSVGIIAVQGPKRSPNIVGVHAGDVKVIAAATALYAIPASGHYMIAVKTAGRLDIRAPSDADPDGSKGIWLNDGTTQTRYLPAGAKIKGSDT